MNAQKFNGQRLKEALQFREKKMTELADETGISKQSLSLYANGEMFLRLIMLLKLQEH